MFLQNNTQEKIQNIKSLAGSIAHETRNPLSAIRSASELIRDNLTQAIELLDLISISSSRGLSIVDIILQNIRDEEIDKSAFINLSMSEIVKLAIKEFAFESEEEKELINIDLEK